VLWVLKVNTPGYPIMPTLTTTKTEAWMTTVMADDQHADCVFANDAKQDSVWETVHETTAHTALDNGVLGWTCANSFDGCIDLGPKLVTEPSALLVVVHDGVIELGYGERMILNLHSETPPVRRKNSA